jgi:6-pyruvoyltetrahydropterin/6-carboxytetrahydropterin synthase
MNKKIHPPIWHQTKHFAVSKEFHFDAAHSLPHLPKTHKCHRLHGHTYTLRVHCSGDLVPDKSWVSDYAEITAAVKPLVDRLDHRNLNEIMGIPQTTAEAIAFWFYMELRDKLPISRIDVHETTGTCASYIA